MTSKSKITTEILHLIVAGMFMLYFICFSNWAMEMMDPNCVAGCLLLFGSILMLWIGNIIRTMSLQQIMKNKIAELQSQIDELRSKRNEQE